MWQRCLAILALWTAPAVADIIINEVLYDPEGADTGYEFVELIAVGEVLSLDGLVLEFCNGADPGNWDLLWSAEPGHRLAPGEIFLIGEGLVVPAPDALVELAMQNGPEALRLRRGEGVLDLLGYGEDLPPELCEAWPALDAPSGKSLSRMPDGVDSNQNILDFFAWEPSPGSLNDPDLELSILAARLPIPPPRPGEEWFLRVEFENTGRLQWPEAPRLSLGAQTLELPRLPSGHKSMEDLPIQPLAEGIHELTLVAGGGSLPPDSLELSCRVGPGPLLLSEVQFVPATGRSEWVECLAPSGFTPNGPWKLVDLSGALATFQLPALAPGERFILCQDRDRLLEEHPSLVAARVMELSNWPSLANLGESREWPPWTEGLRLQDGQGLDSDGLLYLGEWIQEKGRSLERLQMYEQEGASAWAPNPVGSSPLEGPDPLGSSTESAWSLSPQPFDPARESVEFRMREQGASARLRLFDAMGRPVQEIPGNMSSGNLRLLWDGRDREGRHLPSGAYPFLISWDKSAGGEGQQRGLCLMLRSGP
ncbi:hypothetical protein H8E52_10855 [bacterium]|nr:hypothetical protein [bacterium]